MKQMRRRSISWTTVQAHGVNEPRHLRLLMKEQQWWKDSEDSCVWKGLRKCLRTTQHEPTSNLLTPLHWVESRFSQGQETTEAHEAQVHVNVGQLVKCLEYHWAVLKAWFSGLQYANVNSRSQSFSMTNTANYANKTFRVLLRHTVSLNLTTRVLLPNFRLVSLAQNWPFRNFRYRGFFTQFFPHIFPFLHFVFVFLSLSWSGDYGNQIVYFPVSTIYFEILL